MPDHLQKTEDPLYQEGFYPHSVVNEIKDYAIFTMNLEGYFTSWNAGAEQIFGYTPAEIKGKHFRYIFPANLRNQKLPEYELEVTLKDGKYEAEEWHLRKNHEKFWALNVLTAIHDSEGKVISFTKIVKDLTERKRIEDTLYEQSEQLNRVKQDLNKFIYNASHELRPPTCNIEGLLNMLRDDSLPAEAQKITRYLKQSLAILKDRVDEVCQMANFTHRLEQQSPESINLERLLQDIRYLIRNEIATTAIEVRTHLEVAEFTFVPTQLHLIFQQLLLNAIKFADPAKKGYVRVTTRSQKSGILIEVEDNGVGISPQQQGRIFMLFGKADPVSEGQGLGLYYVKRIVEQARGTISVHSQPGEGTTFKVYLPAATPIETIPES